MSASIRCRWPSRDVNELPCPNCTAICHAATRITDPGPSFRWLILALETCLVQPPLRTAGTVFLGPDGWLFSISAYPLLGAAWGYGCFKDEGPSIQGKLLTIRHRAISGRTALMLPASCGHSGYRGYPGRQRSKSLLSVRARLMVNRERLSKPDSSEYGQANAESERFPAGFGFGSKMI